MSRIRVLVVDDEPLARAGVRELLETDAELDVIGEAATVEQAATAIGTFAPDLVMLDVQLPDGTGFDVIRRVGVERMPAVVFITAYDAFAVRAFEVNAVDYLLKPFEDERFAATIERAKKVVRQARAGELSRRLVDLLHGASTPRATEPHYAERVTVKSGGRVFFLRVDEIDWVEAADYYVKLHCGKDRHLLRETMNALETRLDPRKFFRVHRGAIVNLDRVREMQPYFKGEHILILHDGTKLKLSRARRDKLQQALRQRI
jgi:two-component system LytT family response regulator